VITIKDRIPLPNANFLPVLNLDLSPTELRILYPNRFQRHQYVAVISFFKHGVYCDAAKPLEKFHGYSESFEHLCELQDWARANLVLVSPIDQNIDSNHEDFLTQLGYWGYHQKIIDNSEKIISYLEPLAQLLLWNRLGNAHGELGQFDRSIIAYQKSLDLANSIGLPNTVKRELLNMGNAYLLDHNFIAANKCYEQADQFSREVDAQMPELTDLHHRQWQASLLIGRGQSCTMLGDQTYALDYLQQALVISHADALLDGEITALGNLGMVYHLWGDYDQAVFYLLQALQLNETQGHQPTYISTTINLGNSYFQQQKYDQAMDCYQQILSIQQPELDYISQVNALNGCGNVYYGLAEYTQAKSYFEKSHSTSQLHNYQFGVATVLINLGECYTKMNQPRSALDHLNEAVQILYRLQDLTVHTQPWAYYRVAKIYYENNLCDLAQGFLTIALEIAENSQLPILKECQDLATQLVHATTNPLPLTEQSLSLARFQQLTKSVELLDDEYLQSQLADVLQMLEILPTDNLAEVAGKAVTRRSIGQTAAAIQGFQEFGQRFPDALPDTARYVATACLFTEQIQILQVSGGVYIYQIDLGSEADQAGLKTGDIITHCGHKPVVNPTELFQAISATPTQQNLHISVLRCHPNQQFTMQAVTVFDRPLGIQFVGI
jgi:tetratricopeptide (TPR) repeat protein